jgi:WD40 repeat protein
MKVESLIGHTRPITICKYSINGRLATVSQDKILVWDQNTCVLQLLGTVDDITWIHSFLFSTSSNVVVGLQEDVKGGGDGLGQGSGEGGSRVKGSRLEKEAKGMIQGWDECGSLVQQFYTPTITCLDSNNHLLLGGGPDGIVYLYNKGTLIQSYSAHSSPIRSVCFSTDATLFISCNSDSIRLWDIHGSCLKTILVSCISCTLTRNSRFIFCCTNNAIQLYSLHGVLQKEMVHSNTITMGCFVQNDIYVGGQGLFLLGSPMVPLVHKHISCMDSFKNKIAISCWDDVSVRIYTL